MDDVGSVSVMYTQNTKVKQKGVPAGLASHNIKNMSLN